MSNFRRMISNDIVATDAFNDMSINARCLYFHLVMNADNRGYINNARSIISCFDDMNTGHLQELIAKKFVLDRDRGLYLIKHWYIHNDIPRTKVEETRYIDDLKHIYFDENNAYTVRQTDKPVIETLKSHIKEKKKLRKRNKKENEKENESESK